MKLIIGKGALAQALVNRWPDAVVVGRPEFDFSKQQDCDRLVEQYPTPHLVVNTLGVLSNDVWQNLLVNFVVPSYITSRYIDVAGCHIVNISSASAWWVSYPNLDIPRFSYNIAKESLSAWGKHANRITIDSVNKALISTVEPGKFKSPMSGWTGQEIDAIVDCVALAVEKKLQHVSCVK